MNLLQIVNIIDDKNRAAIGAASETSVAGGGANDGSGVIRGRDGSDVQVSEANLNVATFSNLNPAYDATCCTNLSYYTSHDIKHTR